MHLLDIQIHHIVDLRKPPYYAHYACGTAAFNQGRIFHFHVNLPLRYGLDEIVTIVRPTERWLFDAHYEYAVHIIREELGLAEILKSEPLAFKPFERERLQACQALMSTNTS